MKKEITLPMTSHFFKHADSKKERSIFLFDQLSLITVHRCLLLIINSFFVQEGYGTVQKVRFSF